jgi:DNA-binding protein H-NS
LGESGFLDDAPTARSATPPRRNASTKSWSGGGRNPAK